jgi:hypothetical protein
VGGLIGIVVSSDCSHGWHAGLQVTKPGFMKNLFINQYNCSPEQVLDPLAPSFFSESINFDRGQAAVFFREVLKVLTREPAAHKK